MPTISKEQLASHLEDLLAAAKQAGADAAEAQLGSDHSLTVKVRNQQLDSLEYEDDQSASVSVLCNQRKGVATTTELTPEGLKKALNQALTIARFTEPDKYAGLADKALMASNLPDLSVYHPWQLGPEQATDIAQEIEAASLGYADSIKQTEGAQVITGEGISAYGNSHGFIGVEQASFHAYSVTAIAENVSGMQRDAAASRARDAHDLEDPAAIGIRAAKRAADSLDARTPPTTTAPVLYTPRVARSIWGHLISAISGGALYRDASFLKDKINTQVMANGIELKQRPHLLKGLSSTAFDGDGVATQNRDLITDGILQGYVLSAYSARRLGLQSTGNAGGVFNLEVTPGADDFATLVKNMGHGLVVTQLMGQGVNMINGDYSRGAAGFWVENGELAYPVQNVTIAGNLADMFMRIQAVGSDLDHRSSIITPSICIDAMTIAGQ